MAKSLSLSRRQSSIIIFDARRYNIVMPDELPDRLSINPRSPYYNEEILKRSVGIRFNGVERTNVEEYCVSEGWIRVSAGRAVDRHGNPLLMKLKGTVEPFFKETPSV